MHNKLVLITGASQGIGAATARAMAGRGARVVLLARTASALETVVGDIRETGGEAHAYPVDLSDAVATEQVITALLDDHGVPDIVVHNAGAGRWRFVEETSPEEAVAMMAVPYFAAFFVTRFVLPPMLARRSGHFVVVNSPAARLPWPGATGYTAARWALMGFTNALRTDLHGTGLYVTSVVAGRVSSGYFDNNPGSAERIPSVGHLYAVLKPEDVADMIIRGVKYKRREIWRPRLLGLTAWLHRFFPRLVELTVTGTGHKHARP